MPVKSIPKNALCRWNPKTGFECNGSPFYVVGTNYVASHVCTNFWEDWRPGAIASDLARIAKSGFNAVRIPVHWEYAEPAPGRFRPEMLRRMDVFIETARKRGLWVMPWFLVGVATQNYDVSWREGGKFFGEFMTDAAERHLSKMVGHLARHPNILCWDICDEPEWFSQMPGADQLPYNTEQFHAWLERMLRAVKQADPRRRSVTLGFGHIANGNFGMDIRRAAETLDVMAVTAYPPNVGEDFLNGFRSGYFLGWSVRFNDCAGKGVFSCEAPGYNDIDASEANVARYYRVALMSNFINGARGVMPWVWNDFDDSIQSLPPLDRHTSEKRFGIARPDGSLKPAGEELRRFAGFVRDFPSMQWRPVSPEVGVLVPVRSPPEAHREFSRLFHHYILLRQAGARVRYLWRSDIAAFHGRLLFLPDSEQNPLMTSDWLALRSWVERGGQLIATNPYSASAFNELFGVELEGRRNAYDNVVFNRCEEPFGGCRGMSLPGGHLFNCVVPRHAKVFCRDTTGQPLLTRNRLGKGTAMLICYPPENALQRLPPEALGRHGAHRLFRAALAMAGLRAPAACPDPRVELDVRRHAADGRVLVIAVNHSRFPLETSLRCAGNGGELPLLLEGNDVAILALKTKKPKTGGKNAKEKQVSGGN